MTANRRTLGTVLVGAFLVVFCLVQLFPFYIALTTALKLKSDDSSQLLPPLSGATLDNFRLALTTGDILPAIGNSAVVTAVSTVLVCLLGAFAAYPLARRPTRFNRGVVVVVVGLMMVPALSVLVPLYTLLAQLQLLDTRVGVVLVMVATNLPQAVFLYVNFLRTLPLSVEEAARMDGAGSFRLVRSVVLPMLRPVTATVAILSGVTIWNEYALSGYILTSPESRTTAPAIASFFSIQSSNLPAAAAASLIALLPVLIAYLFLQRQFIQGVAGAEK